MTNLYQLILQTNQQLVQQGYAVISFVFLFLFIIAMLAIFHVFIRWVIGTSVIIKNQGKIIELLTRLISQKDIGKDV